MRAWLRRLLCRHRWCWSTNRVAAKGGSLWFCHRCGSKQYRACVMPDLDALMKRLDAAPPGTLVEIGANSPPFSNVWDSLKELLDARLAKAEVEEAQRAGAERLEAEAERDRLQKANCDALVAGVAQLEADCRRLRVEVEVKRNERDDARHHLANQKRMCRIYMDAADRVFQGRFALLPDFLCLGDCKAEGIVRLAEAYINLRDRHRTEIAAHAKAVEERDRWYAAWEAKAQEAHALREYHPHNLTPNPEGPAG